MQRAEVIISGLVVVGVFGLVFAGQVGSQTKFSSQSGDAVVVGAAACGYGELDKNNYACVDIAVRTCVAGTAIRTCSRCWARHSVPNGCTAESTSSHTGCSKKLSAKQKGTEPGHYTEQVGGDCGTYTSRPCQSIPALFLCCFIGWTHDQFGNPYPNYHYLNVLICNETGSVPPVPPKCSNDPVKKAIWDPNAGC